MLKRISLFFFILFCATSYPKNIIWDIGDVLIGFNRLGMIRDIGLLRIATYILLDRKLPLNFQARIFSLVRQVKNESQHELLDVQNVPDLYQDLFTGAVTSKEAMRLISEKADEIWQLDQTPEQQDNPYFVSEREKELIVSGARAMFDPIILAKNAYPLKQIAALVKECAEVVDYDGNPVHQQFILSNFASDAFDELIHQGHCNEAFEHINPDNMVISGKAGLAKPDPEIFKFILKKYNLNPEDSVFVDDRADNIAAARAAGIAAVHLIKPDQNYLRAQFQELGILS